MRIDVTLAAATARLSEAGSDSPRLDAELLLGEVMGRERTWFYTWGDRDLGSEAGAEGVARFEALLARRAEGHPVAHLLGRREFYGLTLACSPATLIPRPDTEVMVECALELAEATSGKLLDLGTGTGAIALAFARHRPQWQVLGVDLIEEAVQLARGNAERLAIANAEFRQSDWFSAVTESGFALITANPPYLADDDPHLALGDVRFEPRSALVAAEAGLADFLHLIATAPQHLAAGGHLMLEHGLTQGNEVREALRAGGFVDVETLEDLGGRERITLGKLA
ncbi:peptide chain release factor N(5)-glutamine methyltransferase [Cobetia sp. D5]|uniref:peptide chain release factor N(5)-glutamine methyltransferase n=1 Tax=unclassified Cobetia TaxID=2609414 RepID=UPI001C055DA8|nr:MULTISPECIES: peptide chain release factor N(5)-glutamine methyltransferase [unclassified Cobetia]MBR9753999.1 peptide chain release factor N(5)-glutamine methyltransferase [Gammaproteobacteria bacterium]QWN37519.1 peptide chain release factor N(5)-glutamine methyltransferase [Cobetia sp. 4B]